MAAPHKLRRTDESHHPASDFAAIGNISTHFRKNSEKSKHNPLLKDKVMGIVFYYTPELRHQHTGELKTVEFDRKDMDGCKSRQPHHSGEEFALSSVICMLHWIQFDGDASDGRHRGSPLPGERDCWRGKCLHKWPFRNRAQGS